MAPGAAAHDAVVVAPDDDATAISAAADDVKSHI